MGDSLNEVRHQIVIMTPSVLLYPIQIVHGPGSVVSIVSGYGLDGPGIVS